MPSAPSSEARILPRVGAGRLLLRVREAAARTPAGASGDDFVNLDRLTLFFNSIGGHSTSVGFLVRTLRIASEIRIRRAPRPSRGDSRYSRYHTMTVYSRASLRADVARERLAVVDADADLQPGTPFLIHLALSFPSSSIMSTRRFHRLVGVLRRSDGRATLRHHRVADELSSVPSLLNTHSTISVK